MLALLVISAVSVLGVFGCMDSGHTGREQGAQPLRPSESPTAHPFERRLVDLNGMHLSIVEAGTGYPVIFVHGVVTTSNIFPNMSAPIPPTFGESP